MNTDKINKLFIKCQFTIQVIIRIKNFELIKHFENKINIKANIIILLYFAYNKIQFDISSKIMQKRQKSLIEKKGN